MSVWFTFDTLASTRLPEFCTTSRRTPGGRVAWICSILASTPSETLVVEASEDLTTFTPTASRAVEDGERAGLLGAHLHVGHVGEVDGAAAVATSHRNAGEVFGALDAAFQADRLLLPRHVHAAHGRGEVGRLQRLHHLSGRDAGGGEVAGAQFDGQFAVLRARHVDARHAADGAQLARDLVVGEVRQVRGRHPVGRERDLDDRQVVGREAPDDGLLHLRRKVAADAGDGVADLVGGLLRVLREDELDDDLAVAVRGRAVDHVHAFKALQRLLDRVEQFALHRLGRGAGVRHAHEDDGRVDLGELVGFELQQRDDAEDDEREHRHDGDERLLDGEVRDDHGAGGRASSQRPPVPPVAHATPPNDEETTTPSDPDARVTL